VAAVDEDHVKARLLDERGRAAECLGGVDDLVLGHAAHRQTVGVDLVVRAERVCFGGVAVAAGVGVLAAVRQLHDRGAAVAVHGLGRFLERGQRAHVVQRDLLGVRTAHRVHNAQADGHAGQAAARTVFMEGDIFLAHMAVRIHFRVGHRRAQDPVFERQSLDGQRACQMGVILVLHS